MFTRRYLIDSLVLAALGTVLFYIADHANPLRGMGIYAQEGLALAIHLPGAIAISGLLSVIDKWIDPPSEFRYVALFVGAALQWLWLKLWWDRIVLSPRLTTRALLLSLAFCVFCCALCGLIAYQSNSRTGLLFYVTRLAVPRTARDWQLLMFFFVPQIMATVGPLLWMTYFLICSFLICRHRYYNQDIFSAVQP